MFSKVSMKPGVIKVCAKGSGFEFRLFIVGWLSEHEEAELGRHVEIEDSVVDGEIIEVSGLFRLISD